MKKILYIALIGGLSLGVASCQKDFLNLEPLDKLTDAVYFANPSDFKSYSSGFYTQLLGWQSPYGGNSIYQYMDESTDLSSSNTFSSEVGRGTITISNSDTRWDKSYAFIRTVNILIQKAASYKGNKDDIKQYVSEAYFFRANAYFNLLKFFGGVPIALEPLDLDELKIPRSSRYEVVDQILSDLDNAIANLPTESAIPSTEKGRISKWAAKAFKAKVLLYEATWRKYNGTSTDFEGSAQPASDQTIAFLTESASLAKDVMDNGGYTLWNYNSNTAVANQSSFYLFNLEDAGSNPAGLTKASNNEFILYGVYDLTLRPGGQNISHTAYNLMSPSRKMMDMFLMTDGLPPEKSPLFQGYHHFTDEFKNRDLRLLSYISATPSSVDLTKGGSGYGNRKFGAYNYGSYRNANQESANYPILRLAEVYLIYAEALFEKNGAISDAQLDESINKVRNRAGVARLTNSLATTNGLNILNEIRRERAIELYREGSRFDDLKRWGIAETELNKSVTGEVVGDASYTTSFRTSTGAATSIYNPAVYVWGEELVSTPKGMLKAVVIDSKANRNFTKKNYLWPIPQGQIDLYSGLKQNPGYN